MPLAQTQDMNALAHAARALMPPETSFRPEDGAVIVEHRDFLLGLGPGLVPVFYDTLFAHAPTHAVFREGERPMREQSLAAWWERTVTGPHDDSYFAWMAMVGLVHVIRDVPNPMMLAMSDFVARAVEAAAREALPADNGARLTEAYRRLTATVSAVITYGYDVAIENALYDVAGMPQALLHRLRNQEVDRALAEARSDLGRQRIE